MTRSLTGLRRLSFTLVVSVLLPVAAVPPAGAQDFFGQDPTPAAAGVADPIVATGNPDPDVPVGTQAGGPAPQPWSLLDRRGRAWPVRSGPTHPGVPAVLGRALTLMPALGVVPGFGPGPGLTFEVEGQATVDLLVVARRTTGLDRHRFEEQEIASYQVQLHRPGRLPGTHLRSAESGTLNVLALPGRTSIRCRISGRLGGYLVRFDLPTVPSILLSGGDEDTPTDHADPGDRT